VDSRQDAGRPQLRSTSACAAHCSATSKIRLSEALIAGKITERPAFLEVYLDANQLLQYHLTNLVSNQVDSHAPTIDPLLANPWGLARSAGSPWWISDNDTGWSTLYNVQPELKWHSRL
jgi:hypothetical protein